MKLWQKLLLALSILAIFSALSCSKQRGEPKLYTGDTINAQVISAFVGPIQTGKLSYAIVNRNWLLWCYPDFKAWIGEGQYGILKWTDRSQCTFFATAFEAYIQKAYFRQSFHDNISAPGIAAGIFWYVSDTNTGHAVIQVITEDGREFYEPQTGQFITLTQAQISSAYMKKFD